MFSLNVKTHRLFSSQNKKATRLVFAKLCENGQGSNFRFRLKDNTKLVNVNYTTFWNDFSHYSLAELGDGPESIDITKEDMLFAIKEKFTQLPSSLVAFEEQQSDKFTTELFEHNSPNDGTFSAFLP